MNSRYNIYFAGQLMEGHALPEVRASIAKLFKADQATLDKLFSGKAQLVKRECDKATALKYKQAFEQAGARPIIKAADSAGQGRVIAAEASTTPGAAMTAAERIAALAEAPDMGGYPAGNARPAQAGTGAASPAPEGLGLAPEGTEVLRPEERAEQVIQQIDTSALELAGSGRRLSEAPPPPPPAPDTSHLSTAAVGEMLPTLPSGDPPLDPDTSAIDLSPEGTDFSDCAGPDVEAPPLDLSGLDLAPAGAEVLEPQYRRRQSGQPPATDHLALED